MLNSAWTFDICTFSSVVPIHTLFCPFSIFRLISVLPPFSLDCIMKVFLLSDKGSPLSFVIFVFCLLWGPVPQRLTTTTRFHLFTNSSHVWHFHITDHLKADTVFFLQFRHFCFSYSGVLRTRNTVTAYLIWREYYYVTWWNNINFYFDYWYHCSLFRSHHYLFNITTGILLSCHDYCRLSSLAKKLSQVLLKYCFHSFT